MKAGPSAQLVPAWKRPCQCFDVSSGDFQNWAVKNTDNGSGLEHGIIIQLIDYINLEVVAPYRAL